MISFAVSESDGSTSKLVLTFLGNTHSRSLTALVSRIYVDIELKSFTDDAIDERVESDIIELQFKTEKKKFSANDFQSFHTDIFVKIKK